MSRKQVLVSLLAIPLLVFLIACGGDKKDSSAANDGGGSNSSNSSNAGGGSNSNAGGGSVSSNDGVISLENCKQYAAMEAAATKAFGGTGSGFKLDEKALNDLAKNSPSEIRSDMTLVVGTIIEVFQSIEKLGINLSDPASMARLDATKLAEFEKVGAKFEDKKFTDASERIEKYFVSKCS